MSNTSLGMALKGSKLRMQQVANNKDLTAYFSHLLNEKFPVTFLSPLAKDNFKEFELAQLEMCKDITWGFGGEVWFKNQPQWDGIAISADRKTLYLIEAKSHIDEMKTKCTANKESIDTIKQMIIEGSRFVPHDSEQDLEKWINGYYQMANRLIFLQILLQQKDRLRYDGQSSIKNVKLVLLNFINDITMPFLTNTKSEWEVHYEIMLRKVFGTSKLQLTNDVAFVYMDIDYGKGIERRIDCQKIEKELDEKIKDIDSFYQQDFVNFRGVTTKYQWVTDYIAELILEKGYLNQLNNITPICRIGKSYNMNHNCSSFHNESNRHEEKIAMFMKRKGIFLFMGKILDYQVPLKNTQFDKAGKIDLLAYDENNNVLRILELKTPNNNTDSFLKCMLEVETYKRILIGTNITADNALWGGCGLEKLKADFNLPRHINATNVVATSLIFEDMNCRAYREFKDVENNFNISRLFGALKQEVICINPLRML